MKAPPLADAVGARMQQDRLRNRPGRGRCGRKCPQPGRLQALPEHLCVRPSKLACTWIPLGPLSSTFRTGRIQRWRSARSEVESGSVTKLI